MRIKHVLMMVGLTLVMVVLGLSVGREGSSVVVTCRVSSDQSLLENGPVGVS